MFKSIQGTKDELSTALNQLEAYVLDLKEPTATVSRTILTMRSLFMSNFDLSFKKRHLLKTLSHDDVLHAVETINRHRFFIEKLWQGTPDEKELAESFLQKIDIYNKSCETRLQNSMDKGKGLARFLFGKWNDSKTIPPKIFLSQKIKSKKQEIENLTSDDSLNLDNSTDVISIPKQSLELFQMKVISLLEKHGIATSPEARSFVKESPIKAKALPNSSRYTLMQTLSLFPGQTIVVKASSTLDTKSQAICKLFPENFCLSLESSQTGFPHPSQRSGWTLSHQLLPENPQRIDLLALSATILRKRAEAISELHTQGEVLNKAKGQLSEKKKYFHEHKEKLINLHCKLSLTIAKAFSVKQNHQLENAIINFFEFLKTHPHPFEYLTETHHEIRDSFIVKPHENLINAILHGKSTALNHKELVVRYLAARQILEDSQEKICKELFNKNTALKDHKDRNDFILHFGQLIGVGSISIMLQYFSEDLVFLPPKLSSFETKMQACAFSHLNGFLTELEMENLPLEKIEDDLLEDIAIFNSEGDFPICQELQEYFAKRYERLKDIVKV